MVWIQIRTYVLLILIWVQTVCKSYRQMTNVYGSKELMLVWGPGSDGIFYMNKQDQMEELFRLFCGCNQYSAG